MLTNLNPSNPGLIRRNVATFYIPELSRPTVTVIKDSDSTLTNLITALYKTTSNAYLQKTFGQVQSVLPVESIENTNQTKYLIKYKVGASVATVTMDSFGKIINIITKAEK